MIAMECSRSLPKHYPLRNESIHQGSNYICINSYGSHLSCIIVHYAEIGRKILCEISEVEDDICETL